MESLLSTYASSDEEDEHPQLTTITNPSPSPSSLFSSLPKPQSSSSSSSSSSSIFSSKEEEDPKPPSKPSSFLSSLPVPKSQPTKKTPDFSLPPPIPKRVVQFHPPLPQPLSNNRKNHDKDEEEDEEDEEEKQRKKKRQLGHDTSVKSFLSSMPTPKNSLGSSLGGGGSASAGSGRRSIVETEGPVPSNDGKCEVGIEYNVETGEEKWSNGSNSQNYEVGIDQNNVGYEGYGGGYDSYGSYGQYEASWSAPESSVQVESFVNMGGGKRRKDQVPVEIVEVKQDELMKDRPREDKSRLTGIAFGPSYQPTSTKGKPSKLHKRKHQIGSLYFDMKQKEMELAERRSKGLLTKAETQAKYGW